VARWALNSLDEEEIEQLRGHDIALRWMRR
jgi:hypothetical protein